MKRFALILVSLLTVFGMQSQIVSSRSEAIIIKKEKKQRVPSKYEFYAKAGLNIMSTDWCYNWDNHFNPSELSTTKSVIGFDIALGFMSHFRPSNPSDFYWGAEAGLTQVGGGFEEFKDRYQYGHLEYIYPSQNFRSLGVFITPVIGWNKPLSEIVSLDLHLNPGASFNFGNNDVKRTIRNIKDDTSSQSTFPVGSNIYPLLKIGVGVWINKFNIDLSYMKQPHFDDVYNSYNNFIISLGYKL